MNGKRCGIDREREIDIDIHTMEYYSAIKKNAKTPFAAPWVDLKIIILRGIS